MRVASRPAAERFSFTEEIALSQRLWTLFDALRKKAAEPRVDEDVWLCAKPESPRTSKRNDQLQFTFAICYYIGLLGVGAWAFLK